MPAKVVICQHSVLSADYLRTKGWSHRVTPLIYRLIAPGFARAVAVSAGIAREFRCIAHIPRDKIAVIHNPVIGAILLRVRNGRWRIRGWRMATVRCS